MKLMHKLAMIAIFCLTATAGSLAHADDSIGYVKTLTGDAWIKTGGKEVKAALGMPVFLGSVLITSKNGSMGVTFKDSTRMSFGPDTQMTVDEYLYTPAQTQGKLKLSTSLSKGTLNYVSGLIAKFQPDAVSVRTPGGTIGVRGTQFLVKVAPQDAKPS